MVYLANFAENYQLGLTGIFFQDTYKKLSEADSFVGEGGRGCGANSRDQHMVILSNCILHSHYSARKVLAYCNFFLQDTFKKLSEADSFIGEGGRGCGANSRGQHMVILSKCI